MPFQLVALPAGAALQRQCAELYAARRFPFAVAPGPARQAGDKIRIAYLSGGLRRHATGILAVEIFEHHDRARFETIALSFTPDDGSPLRRRMAAAFDRFIDVSREDDAQIAARLTALEADIVIDLDGYTEGSRPGIIAQCPAPVRVSWLGYPGTSGAPFIDYLIADGVVAPPGSDGEFSERLVRLPGSYQPNSERAVGPAPSRADCGLPDGAFVFCAFNNSFKITPDMFSVWMRLLKAVDGSVLWILEANALQKSNLHRETIARGMDPDRLVFAPRLDPDVHLARHVHADLFLDTTPCNAHTTASDALGMGVPLITCVGPAFPGRVAASLLTVCGLPELITHSLADYESMALKLARDPAMLAALKERLRQNRTTLFDTERTTRTLEQAYETMVRRP
jgi:predicted O-linked N-acetylglucosamine transferase (SPINDLY family)